MMQNETKKELGQQKNAVEAARLQHEDAMASKKIEADAERMYLESQLEEQKEMRDMRKEMEQMRVELAHDMQKHMSAMAIQIITAMKKEEKKEAA
jgi:hypothetical protein